MSHANFTATKTTTHDIYRGHVLALLDAGIIQQKHLEPQPGRRKGCTLFLPDGAIVPAGMTSPTYLPGLLAVQCRDDECEVRLTVTFEERRARQDAEPTLYSDFRGSQSYRGSREGLLRDGIPESWLDGVPAPGKKRGRRVMYEGERRISVSAGAAGIRVEVTHISYYESWGSEAYARMRAEYGLPLTGRGHLQLVWSA